MINNVTRVRGGYLERLGAVHEDDDDNDDDTDDGEAAATESQDDDGRWQPEQQWSARVDVGVWHTCGRIVIFFLVR